MHRDILQARPKPVGRDVMGEVINLDVEQRDLLAQIVVQIARDPLALILLARDEPPGEMLIDLGRAPRFGLRAATPFSLDEKAHGQRERTGP
jgi:hypothetical protein